jgi:hypothetical protein
MPRPSNYFLVNLVLSPTIAMLHLNPIIATTAFVSVSLLTIVPFGSDRNLAIQVGSGAHATQPQPLRWSPDKGRGSAGGTLSGGRRGADTTCSATPEIATSTITLLVPGASEGLLTTSATPALHWYVDTQKPVAMTFVLQHPNQATPVYKQEIQQDRSGMVSVALPVNQPLETGTRYRWSVFLSCTNSQAGEVVARSFIERVERADLVQKVAGRTAFERASIFARAGIWYDAVSLLISAYQQTPQNTELKTGLKSLLQQAESEPSEQRLTQVFNRL